MPFDPKLIIGAAVAGIIARIVGEDIRSFVPRFSERLLRDAAARLNPSCAERYLEEWLADQEHIPEILGKIYHSISIRYLGCWRLARVVGINPKFSGTNSRLIRSIDVVSVLLAAPVLSIFLLTVTGVVALFSVLQGRRIFILDECIGREGRIFVRYAFNITESGPLKILRKTSISELPMVINVIRGEMSLVGPPPMRKKSIKGGIADAAPIVRPGLTGFWQLGTGRFRKDSAIQEGEEYTQDFSASDYIMISLKTGLLGLRGLFDFKKK
jgi:lipopolysaccharide/colanic/teichoic acid biosynthesis glycosyltransferase